MNPPPPADISCRIIAEFDDDASNFAQAEPEFVPVSAAPTFSAPASPRTYPPYVFSPPTKRAEREARDYWRRLIRRFTEAVPGKKNRFRLPDAEEPTTARIAIEFGRVACGYEVYVGDRQCLALFDRSGPFHGKNGPVLEESTILIPWTEIVHVRLVTRRPAEEESQSAAPS